MRRFLSLGALFSLSTMWLYCQSAPLTLRQACAKFSDAVVQIDAGGVSRGSGFLVSPDGLILTASHVVMDTDGKYHPAIFVTLSNGDLESAVPAVPASPDSVGEDFALLKINAKSPLPFLTLGSVDEVVIGDDATIIGFPFSAISPINESVSKKFCLQASFAATEIIGRDISESQKAKTGFIQVNKHVTVDVIYFQGPSVKGISGSPIISRGTGNVVGIVSTKLTGIGPALNGLKDATANGFGMTFVGVDAGKAFNQIVVVLDEQLANGLGSAVGIDDPKEALKQTQRHKD